MKSSPRPCRLVAFGCGLDHRCPEGHENGGIPRYRQVQEPAKGMDGSVSVAWA